MGRALEALISTASRSGDGRMWRCMAGCEGKDGNGMRTRIKVTVLGFSMIPETC